MTEADILAKLDEAKQQAKAFSAAPGCALLTPQEQADVLRDRLASLVTTYAFTPGDLVTWKPDLSNRNNPKEGHPAIVVEVLPLPYRNEKDSIDDLGAWEPLDMRGGALILAGVNGKKEPELAYVEFYVDKRRFQRWAP
jgi:hypothetical protein